MATGDAMTFHPDRSSQTPARYDAEALRDYATDLLRASGVDAAIAGDVADVLLDGDLMGHTTHGLALLAGYLGQLADGGMRKSGEPAIVAQSDAAQTWDGRR